jgi:DNA-binding response OmpR family regulator
MKHKILIIEDNKILSDMYKFKLSLEWFEVMVENESNNSMRIVSTFQPDLIVLDLMMPGMNWFDILKNLKKDNDNKVKIIISSNLSSQEDKDTVMWLWADKFLLKSNTSPKELIEEIRSLLV